MPILALRTSRLSTADAIAEHLEGQTSYWKRAEGEDKWLVSLYWRGNGIQRHLRELWFLSTSQVPERVLDFAYVHYLEKQRAKQTT